MNSAKLIMWERKGSLSFKNNLLTASCQCTLQFCGDQRWLGKGGQDFPHSGPTHSPWASKSICSEGYFARLVRNKDLWEPATISGACQSLLTQDRDFIGDTAVSGRPSNYWDHVLNYCNGMVLYIFSENFIFQGFYTLPDFFFLILYLH